MYKLSGAVLIISMTTYYGFYLVSRLKERINVIDAFIYSFDYIRSQIRYGLPPFPVICRVLSQNINNNIVSSTYENIYIKLTDISRTGGSFDEIWLLEMDKLLKSGFAKKEEIDALKELRCINIYIDKQMQITCINTVSDKLKNTYCRLQQEVRAKSRIYQVLGVMSGVIIAIILI